MLIVGPSLVILFLATLVVLFIKYITGKGFQNKRVIKEEHLYKRGDPELDKGNSFINKENNFLRKNSERKRDDENLNRGSERRKGESPMRKNPEPECC